MNLDELPKGYSLVFQLGWNTVGCALTYYGQPVETFTIHEMELNRANVSDEAIWDMVKRHQATMIPTQQVKALTMRKRKKVKKIVA